MRVKKIEIYIHQGGRPHTSWRVGLYHRSGSLPTKLLLDAGAVDVTCSGIIQIVCDVEVDPDNLPFIVISSADGVMSAFSGRVRWDDYGNAILSPLGGY